MISETLVAFFRGAYPDGIWPKPFHLLQGCLRVDKGEASKEVARSIGTTPRKLEEILKSGNPALAVLGVSAEEIADADVRRARLILAQLLIGRAAELAFESIYRTEVGPETEFKLVDLRESRTDTDYRVLNGRGRPVYRLNIKFFGSVFRRGAELVGLQPDDCFPLATYKIYGALQKQEQEHLPYIFAIVGVPNLTAASIEGLLDKRAVEIVALISKSKKVAAKRDIEDRVVRQIVDADSPSFQAVYKRIHEAGWYILSARRADKLLRELLFDRVFALKIRGFAQQFRRAELDMHFSLSKDLMPLRKFLGVLNAEGQTKVASLLERGTV